MRNVEQAGRRVDGGTGVGQRQIWRESALKAAWHERCLRWELEFRADAELDRSAGGVQALGGAPTPSD